MTEIDTDICRVCGAGCCNCKECIALQGGEEHLCCDCFFGNKFTPTPKKTEAK